MITLDNIIFYIFIMVFCVGVVVNLIGPKGIVDSYKRWGLPGWFRYITAALEALTMALVFTNMAKIGYALALWVMGSAIIILVFNKEYKPVVAPVLTCAMIIFLMR